jgi:hypothetical protein
MFLRSFSESLVQSCLCGMPHTQLSNAEALFSHMILGTGLVSLTSPVALEEESVHVASKSSFLPQSGFLTPGHS